jgi:hypothetical protein
MMTDTPEELRGRIPGWGADADPADRPAVPRERTDLPEQRPGPPTRQHTAGHRERSIEHADLTAVFGTAQPLHGVSGLVRRFAYARYSEARAAHWLLLMLGDRIEALGARRARVALVVAAVAAILGVRRSLRAASR